jgi:RHS repeat-associated protein
VVAYVYGLDLVSQTRGSTQRYFGYDGLGTVRYLTTTEGAVDEQFSYDAFGIMTVSSGTAPADCNYRYTGEQWDADLRMYYLRARYYKPELGRFWTMDSYEGESADQRSLHKYLYVGGSPVNLVDPSGNFFDFISLMSSMGIVDIAEAGEATPSVLARQAARKFGDELKDMLNFEDPKPVEAIAKAAEVLWVERCISLGMVAIPLQESTVGTHGPDMVAFGMLDGKFRIVVGEIKGMRQSRVLSSLGKLSDNVTQMSATWIDRGLSTIAGGLVDFAIKAAGTYVPSDIVAQGLQNVEFDLYLLRGRRYFNGWQLKGFRLMHVGTKGVGLDEDNHTQLDEYFPAGKGRLPDPPGIAL